MVAESMATELATCYSNSTSLFIGGILGLLINLYAYKRGRSCTGLAANITIFLLGWLFGSWFLPSIAAIVAAVLIFKRYHLAKEEPNDHQKKVRT